MMILQILSHKSWLYDKRLLSYNTFRHFTPLKTHFGGLPAPQKWQLAQNNFFRSFSIFGKFLELHFFQFQKKVCFYSTLIFNHLNNVNSKMQGKNETLLTSTDKMKALREKNWNYGP